MPDSHNFQHPRTSQNLAALFMRLAGRFHASPSADGHGADRITVHQLSDLISAGEEMVLVDIRLPWEYEEGHIPGSISIPYFQITEAISQELLQGRRVVLYCRVGIKSIRTRNIVRAMGVEDVVDLAGGIFAWEEAGGDTVADEADAQKKEMSFL